MKKEILFLALLFSLILGNINGGYAQVGLDSADKEYEKWAYIDAVHLYEKVISHGYSNQDLLEKIGNAYYFNGRYKDAHTYYQKLFSEYDIANIQTEYFYRYAHTLQNIGDETEAENFYEQFVKKVGDGIQISKNRKDTEALQKQIEVNSNRVDNIVNLAINTPYADYGAFVRDKQFYYTSSRDTGSFSKKRHTWTGATFTSLYAADTDNLETSNKSAHVKGKVKSRLNESTAVITKDGKTMYFTRNNILNGKRRFDDKKSVKLKIYRAERINNEWTNITELPFNSDQFNTAHPALNEKEDILYFSSDRPGGFGQGDLWKVTIKGENFGKPENLGAGINTEAKETFPFVVDDELYYSSNGRVGLGGLDIYAVKIKEDGKFGDVQNIGAPLNSAFDDFAYYIDKPAKKGFFSSNRDGGKGNDDIYSFVELRPIQFECKQDLHIKVIDGKTGLLISDATVTLYDELYHEKGISKQYAPPTYGFNYVYKCGDHYRVKAEKEGYITQEVTVILPVEDGFTEKTIVLEPVKMKFKEGDDLFKVLQLNPIYFDLDKHAIRPDAALELTKIYTVLEEYPNMEIDIRSHTDSRASHKYNEDLSGRRAKSTAEWLILNGIKSSRLTWKGYGETQLVNKCSDGVNCTEEEHQQNRRSEFIITKM